MRRARVFAAPFVVTVALGGCKKDEPRPEPRPEPRASADARPQVAAIDAGVKAIAPDAALPEAPAGAVTVRESDGCYVFPHQAGTGKVRCPPEGATFTLARGGSTPNVSFDWYDLSCIEFEQVNCPPPDVATCNPPPPRDVRCPEELRPTLNANLEPTRKGDACLWTVDGQDYEVKCPPVLPAAPKDAVVYLRSGACFMARGGSKPVQCPTGGARLAVPDDTHLEQPNGDTAFLDVDSLQCSLDLHYDCGGGAGSGTGVTDVTIEHSCNPPPPQPIECPEALLPTLIHGATPTRQDAGKCWWNDVQVRCP